MCAYIPTKKELEEIIARKTKEAIKDILPEAIREATRKEWLTTDDVMEILDCSRRHVQYLRDSEQIPYYQTGRTIRYHIEEVEAFLNDQKVKSRPRD